MFQSSDITFSKFGCSDITFSKFRHKLFNVVSNVRTMRLFNVLIFRFFFWNFFLRRVTLFCNRMNFKKSEKVPFQRASSIQLLGFSGTAAENTWRFEVPVLILSLGYGADLGRSRLVFLVITFRLQCLYFSRQLVLHLRSIMDTFNKKRKKL